MTKTLQEAIARLEQMPEDRQELLVRLMLHEIEQDEQWARTTEAHSDKLASFVDGALQVDHRGECKPLNLERL